MANRRVLRKPPNMLPPPPPPKKVVFAHLAVGPGTRIAWLSCLEGCSLHGGPGLQVLTHFGVTNELESWTVCVLFRCVLCCLSLLRCFSVIYPDMAPELMLATDGRQNVGFLDHVELLFDLDVMQVCQLDQSCRTRCCSKGIATSSSRHYY